MRKNIIMGIITFLVLLTPLNAYAENVVFEYNKEEQTELEGTPTIGCKAAYVAEPVTGKVLFEKNAHEAMYPASTTKILTALVVLEKCQLTDMVTVSTNSIALVPEGYSDAHLIAGEQLSVYDLLEALLIPSANEAANALAEHVSGSIESFADLCNERAKELGCENLHFVNPNGIHNSNHYCTAYDLYLIAKECQKYDTFNEIVKMQSFTLPATNLYSAADRTFENTNSLIIPEEENYYYPYCTGIKTGFTTPAGNCLVASSSYNNINLISVVLGGETENSLGLNERFYDTSELFNFVYSNYSIKEIAKKNSFITAINVAEATRKTKNLELIIDTDISCLAPNIIDLDNVTKEVKFFENITAPVQEKQVLGSVTYKVDGFNYTTEIYASHAVDRLPYQTFNIIVIVALSLDLVLLIVMTILLVKKKWRLLIIPIVFIILLSFVVLFCIFEEANCWDFSIDILDGIARAIKIKL